MKYLITGVAFSILLFSCKKDSGNPPGTGNLTLVTAKIATVLQVEGNEADTSFYQLFYRQDGKFDSMIQTKSIGYKRTYKMSYFPDYALFQQYEYTVGNQFPTSILDSIRLNPLGLPDTVFSFYGGPPSSKQIFNYNANKEIQTIDFFPANGQPSRRTQFFWTNGNITSINENGLIVNYKYDGTRASQPGEQLLWYTRFLRGIDYFQNKNLATSFGFFGGSTVPYQYTWENNLLRTLSYKDAGYVYHFEYTYY